MNSQYYPDDLDTPQIFVEPPPVEEDVIDGQHNTSLNSFPLQLGSHEGAGYYSDAPSPSQNAFGSEQGLFSSNDLDQSTSQISLITHGLRDGGFSSDYDQVYTQPCGTVSSGNVFLSPLSPAGSHSPVEATWSPASSSSGDVFPDHVSDDGSSGWSPAISSPSSPSLSPLNQSLNNIALNDVVDDGVPFQTMSRQRSSSFTGVQDFSPDQAVGRPRSASFTENPTFDSSLFFSEQLSGQFVPQSSPTQPFIFPDNTFDFGQFSSNLNVAPTSPSWDSVDSSSQQSSPQFPPQSSPQLLAHQQLYQPPIGPPSGHPTHGRSQSTHLTVPGPSLTRRGATHKRAHSHSGVQDRGRGMAIRNPRSRHGSPHSLSRSSSRSREDDASLSPFTQPFLRLDIDYQVAGPSMTHPTSPSSVSLSRSQSPVSPASSIDITIPYGQDTSVPVINVNDGSFTSFDVASAGGVRRHISYAGTGSRSSSPSRAGPSGLHRVASDPSGISRKYPRKPRGPNQVRKYPGLLKPAEDVDVEETYRGMKRMEGTLNVNVSALGMGMGPGLELGDPATMGSILKVGSEGGGFKTVVGSDKILKASGERRKNEAKFKCDKCGNSFTAKHNLQNHLNSHNGIRPFECIGCHASFTTKGTYTRHISKCKFTDDHGKLAAKRL
ncbi:hypothetical protein D9758_003895 [Tetrapyrgos nigripes]|uniref:C2H2-type domain-containing protein n=1 Tax=Tetrapyrgos nigripes TaxID=182062 RepID=A0A8H5GLC2_9AGAR|nr:hypothetical protein D9758_003895 [Tetrapyrgos nigripes]